MNWNKLKFVALDLLVIVCRYWYLIAALAVLLIVLYGVDSCRRHRTEKKIERIETNIITHEAQANVLANEKENIKVEVNKNEVNSNLAVNNLNRSLRTDSANFKGSDAGRRFCQRFPEDSSCR